MSMFYDFQPNGWLYNFSDELWVYFNANLEYKVLHLPYIRLGVDEIVPVKFWPCVFAPFGNPTETGMLTWRANETLIDIYQKSGIREIEAFVRDEPIDYHRLVYNYHTVLAISRN